MDLTIWKIPYFLFFFYFEGFPYSYIFMTEVSSYMDGLLRSTNSIPSMLIDSKLVFRYDGSLHLIRL